MWRSKDKAVPNRGWKNRLAGTTCPSCDGTGGGKNTVQDSGGKWTVDGPLCTRCNGTGRTISKEAK